MQELAREAAVSLSAIIGQSYSRAKLDCDHVILYVYTHVAVINY